MRRYDIVTGILLILSIIDFALAAPVLVQEPHQARVDVVHIPKDAITVLRKRWEEDLEKLGEGFLKTVGKPAESSDSTLSSSLAPSAGPDHGSTNIVQAPAPNPASSTANPDPSMEPSSCSPSTSSRQGLRARGSCLTKLAKFLSDEDDFGMVGSMGTDGLGGGLYEPLSQYDPGPTLGGYGYESDHKWMVAPAPEPNPNPNSRLLIDPSVDSGFDWNYWISAEDPPPTRRPDLPSTSGHAGSPPSQPEHEVVSPPSGESPDSEPLDPQAALLYAAKGKAKVVERRISGTARDVGNAAQRELQPAEMFSDPGE